jgi:FtsH-binding integral membrane protein
MLLNEYTMDKKVASFMCGVYAWMGCALTITALIAYYIAITPDAFSFVTQPGVVIGLIFVQLILVIGLVFFINRLSTGTAFILFLLYSASLGITLSSIFYIYAHASIISTFLSAAGMFGFMSFYGYITRSDLTTIGNLSFMALFGLIIGMVINMFLVSTQFDYILSAIGVIVFVALTAYDTQKIKQLGKTFLMKNEPVQKITIIGALTLYLDFINLFLFLLRFLGKRNDR